MSKRSSRTKGFSKLRGELPGEYLKRSLVPVQTGKLSDGGRIKDEHYIVRTFRCRTSAIMGHVRGVENPRV